MRQIKVTLTAFVLSAALGVAASAQGERGPGQYPSDATAPDGQMAEPRSQDVPGSVSPSRHDGKRHEGKRHDGAQSKVDLNAATKDELLELPELTEEQAQMIIDHRPYKSPRDLTKKNVMTKSEFKRLRDHVMVIQEKRDLK